MEAYSDWRLEAERQAKLKGAMLNQGAAACGDAVPNIRAAIAASHELATKAESLASRLCGHPYDMTMPPTEDARQKAPPLLVELREEARDLASHVGRAMAALEAIEKAIQ